VTIAVLDTGVDATHPALAGHLVAGYSAFSGSRPATDPSGHGSWMASIALATAPSAHVMPVQVLDANGLGKDSDIIKGLVWAADHHANVITMSFAGVGYSSALQSAIDYAWSKGAVVVAATGNSGSSKATYPAGDAHVIGVSATDKNDRLWSGSNFGADTFLAAPGVDVVAADRGGGTTTITGTSASAALVAGSAALLLGNERRLTNSVTVGRLARSAAAAGSRFETGNGRLDVGRAVSNSSLNPLSPSGVAGRASGGPFAGPYVAASAPGTPVTIGTASGTGATVVLTLAAGVPANSTIFVTAGEATLTTGGVWSATDNSGQGHVYAVDADSTTGRAAILRTFTSTAMTVANTITVTKPVAGATGTVVSAFYVQGVVSATPLDKATTAGDQTGTSAAWSSGATAATAQAVDFIVSAGIVNSTTITFGSPSCTAIGAKPTSTVGLQAFYKNVVATGAQSCTATLSAASIWGGAVGAYKVDIAPPPAAVTFPVAAAYNAAGWANVTGSGTDESGGSGISATAGKVQLSIHDDTANKYWAGAAWGVVAGAEVYFNPTTGPTLVAPGTAATWSYTFANTNLTNGSQYTVHTTSTDYGGNTSTVASATTKYDTSAPATATLTTNSSYNAAGWSGHVDGTVTDSGTGSSGIATVNVSIADSVSGKCWNGANFTTTACPNWVPVTSGGSAVGAANASWQYNLASTALTDAHIYTVSVQAKDATSTGNTSGTLAAGTFKYDTTPPAFGTLSYVLSGNCNANLFASGATIFYHSSGAVCANAFNARAVVTDATSGPASVNFPAIAASSFAHTNETVPGVSPYTSALNYGWTSTAAAFSSTSTLTAADGAGNTSTANITVTLDNTAPAGGVISVPATVKALSVAITTTNATDGGSGLAAGTNAITRSNGQAVAANACPVGGYSGSNAIGASPDLTVASGQCYVYTLTAADNVGNVATWTTSPVMVDTVVPSDAIALNSVTGGVFKSGPTIFYKGNAAG
jgi:hypothetical protein